MKLILIFLAFIIVLLQIHWNITIIKGLHQIAKNQVGSTKMILEYLQAILKEGSYNDTNTKNN